jgi:hypothetical protein
VDPHCALWSRFGRPSRRGCGSGFLATPLKRFPPDAVRDFGTSLWCPSLAFELPAERCRGQPAALAARRTNRRGRQAGLRQPPAARTLARTSPDAILKPSILPACASELQLLEVEPVSGRDTARGLRTCGFCARDEAHRRRLDKAASSGTSEGARARSFTGRRTGLLSQCTRNRDQRRFRSIESNVAARKTSIGCATADGLCTVLPARALVESHSSGLADLPLRSWLRGMEASMGSLPVDHRGRRGAREGRSRALGGVMRPPMQRIE